jgi:hypothetical protein
MKGMISMQTTIVPAMEVDKEIPELGCISSVSTILMVI